MIDDIIMLQAEIERLRELLIENGIDPEPYDEPPEQFGPPTLAQYLMRQAMTRMFTKAAVGLWKDKAAVSGLSGGSIRIRLPTDYTATP